jgi:hypothetical protein
MGAMAQIRENSGLGNEDGEMWKRFEKFLESELVGLGDGLYVRVTVSEGPRKKARFGA